MDNDLPQTKMIFQDNKKVGQFLSPSLYYRRRNFRQHKHSLSRTMQPRRTGQKQQPSPLSRPRRQRPKPKRRRKRRRKPNALLKKRSKRESKLSRLSQLPRPQGKRQRG